MCAWAGASKWLSQVHGFGSDEWLMCFMNKTTPRAAKGAVMTFLSPSEWHHLRNVYPLIRGSGSIGVIVILFLVFLTNQMSPIASVAAASRENVYQAV